MGHLVILGFQPQGGARASLALGWLAKGLWPTERSKLLVLDVGARITSANQKWMEVPGDEDDGMELVAALVKARADFCVR